MNISVRRFIISMTVTLIIFGFIAGVGAVTHSGQSMLGTQNKSNISYDDILTASEVIDNAISFFAPKFKAAAHWFLIVCAALSELY